MQFQIGTLNIESFLKLALLEVICFIWNAGSSHGASQLNSIVNGRIDEACDSQQSQNQHN
jgi:hypothetical protein